LTHRLFDFSTLAPRAVYKLLIGTVVPRPIAWVTTRSLEGVGRMGGHGYVRTRDYFDLPTLSVAEVEARRRAARTG
jgi:hypothetical protein